MRYAKSFTTRFLGILTVSVLSGMTIDQIIQIINAQIEKLKELRKTLINDVVTGKIKVIE